MVARSETKEDLPCATTIAHPTRRGGPAPPAPAIRTSRRLHGPRAGSHARHCAGAKPGRRRPRTARVVVGSCGRRGHLAVIVAAALTARAAAAGGDRPAATSAVVHIPDLNAAFGGRPPGDAAVGLRTRSRGSGQRRRKASPADPRHSPSPPMAASPSSTRSTGGWSPSTPRERSSTPCRSGSRLPASSPTDDAAIHVLDADEDRRLVSLDWQGTILGETDLESRRHTGHGSLRPRGTGLRGVGAQPRRRGPAGRACLLRRPARSAAGPTGQRIRSSASHPARAPARKRGRGTPAGRPASPTNSSSTATSRSTTSSPSTPTPRER